MKVLVINCGSSSLKYQLIDMETENGGRLSQEFLKENLQTLWVDGILVLVQRERQSANTAWMRL